MKGYGNHFVVFIQESMHTNYDMCPQVRSDIYGIYSSYNHAKKGLRDCAKIAERVWSSDNDEETVVSRIIEDESTVVILKHYFYKAMGKVSRRTSLITVKIDREY